TRITTSFERFMAEEKYRYMPFQYGEALDRISSYVGKEHLKVRVYEKQQFVAGSLFADFLDVLGLGFSEEYALPDYTPNVRLTNSAVEIKRMINSAYVGEDVPDFYRDIISDVFGMKQIKEMPERDTSMFSPELRASFMKEFEESNAYVAREYLGRKDGVLFRGDTASLPQWQMDDHAILMDMIRVFAAEGVALYKRQQEIEKREKALDAKLEKLEKSGLLEAKGLSQKVEELYNSLPFRAYRSLRDKKDKRGGDDMSEHWADESNKILVLGRVKDKNLGDVVIVDSCAYLLNEVIENINQSFFWREKRPFFPLPQPIPEVETANVIDGSDENVLSNMEDYDKIVFPGGGINSLKITYLLRQRLDIDRPTRIYFNGIGIHPERHYDELAENIEIILNDERVRQVTTRGDLAMTQEYVKTEKHYPICLISDPAICASEAYEIKRKQEAETIGIGLIRPDIFVEQDSEISLDEVYEMYGRLFEEGEQRGYAWKVFTNGTQRDYDFAKEALAKFGYEEETHLVRRPTKPEHLVRDISGFKGIIAARFHANIIATSLSGPSIALVWNVKMRSFADLIGVRDRYIEDRERLLNAHYLWDALEKAMVDGYDRERILAAKNAAYLTLKNVVLDGNRFEWYFKWTNRLRKESYFR
ncbi:MAG: polysaccharide pyruvyl transferase family protein, partial [Lachnospiraceae bacterium]|nr:polysaccharide pyruvyl transferase family protein [Lachnospiraceae bacterium]